MEKLLSASNIKKSFGTENVLNDVSFTVNRGEIISILGPSGCGKSTLMQIIAGLVDPDEGEIMIGSELIYDRKHKVPPEKRNLNMVFQDYALWPHLNAFKNIAYGLKNKGYKKNEIQRKIDELLMMLNLKGYELHYPAQLSGGQQQRVAIARALATDPQILLLDEPLSNLDVQLKIKMRSELAYMLRKLGITALHVTHDSLEAFALADKILILRKGVIEQFDKPQNIYNNPQSPWVASVLGINNGLNCMYKGGKNEYAVVDVQGVTMHGRLKKVSDNTEGADGCNAVLMVHPEEIAVMGNTEDAAGYNRIGAKVVNSIYEGRFWNITVSIGEGVLSFPNDLPMEREKEITIGFKKENTLIFIGD